MEEFASLLKALAFLAATTAILVCGTSVGAAVGTTGGWLIAMAFPSFQIGYQLMFWCGLSGAAGGFLVGCIPVSRLHRQFYRW